MVMKTLTLKAPVTATIDEFLLFDFSEKISFDISCETSAWQTIYMNYQDLFSLKIIKPEI